MIESLMGMERNHGDPNIEDYDVEDYDEILSRQLFTYFELNDKGITLFIGRKKSVSLIPERRHVCFRPD